MLRRFDFFILMVALGAIALSLSAEGPLSLEPAFFHPSSPSASSFFSNVDVSDVAPSAQPHAAPLAQLADLNGDGHLELVVAENAEGGAGSHRLTVLATTPRAITANEKEHGGHDGGHAFRGAFRKAPVVASVPLLPSKVRVTTGRRAVALAVGHLDPPHDGVKVFDVRKQVVAVVTAGFQLAVFDHNLQPLWDVPLREEVTHHAHIEQAAVFVTPHAVRAGDRGSVVVGFSAALGGDAETGTLGDGDVFEDELEEEHGSEVHGGKRRGGPGRGDADESVGDESASGADESRHFDYRAFEGSTGTPLWEHTGESFHLHVSKRHTFYSEGRNGMEDDTTTVATTEPQHNYRLDASALSGRHIGESAPHCRDYRSSLLLQLPHVWRGPWDTHLELAHFNRHRENTAARHVSDGASTGGVSARDAATHRARAASARGYGTQGAGVNRGSNPLIASIGKIAEASGGAGGAHRGPSFASIEAVRVQRTHPSVAVGGALHANGLDPLAHGRASSVDRHHPHGAPHALPNAGGPSTIGTKAHGSGVPHDASHRSRRALPPNVLVARTRHGLEVVHLYTGRPVCSAPMGDSSLHVDLDGDGVLDTVEAYGGVSSGVPGGAAPVPAWGVVGKAHATSASGGCMMYVSSGPAWHPEPLFNGTICRAGGVLGEMGMLGRAGQRGDSLHPLEAAMPAAIPRPHAAPRARHTHSHRHRSDLAFLNSRGEVSLYTFRGNLRFSVTAGIPWYNTDETEAHERVVPTIEAFPLRRGAMRGEGALLLAVGQYHGVLLDHDGNEHASFELPSPPVAPAQLMDWDGDGLTDIVIQCTDGYYGIRQRRRIGGSNVAFLLVALAAGMAWLFTGEMGRQK